MAENQVLNWMDGSGWLVLSGGPDPLSEIRAQSLTRIAADGGVAYIGVNEQDNEALIEDLGELGAPTGYLVNVMAEDDDTISQRLADASLIVVPGDIDLSTLRGGLLGAAVKGMQKAFDQGAVILIERSAVMLFGSVIVTEEGTELEGLDWLHNAFVVPAITSISESQKAREILTRMRASIAVGIGEGSALVLGPNSEIELWGKKQVTITLGSNVVARENNQANPE